MFAAPFNRLDFRAAQFFGEFVGRIKRREPFAQKFGDDDFAARRQFVERLRDEFDFR